MKTLYKLKLAKILSFILISLFKFKRIQLVKRNSVHYSLDLEQGIDISLFLLGSFQKKIIDCALKLILSNRPKKLFSIIDIGSNIGDKSISLAKKLLDNKITNFKIYSLEPTTYAFNKQKKNLNLNPKLKKYIYLRPVYLSNIKKKVKKTYSSWNLFRSHNKFHGGQKEDLHKNVKFLTLDLFIKKYKINNIVLIKIDTDGSEFDILKSAKNFLSKFNTFIIMEFNPFVLKLNDLNNFYKYIKDLKINMYHLNLSLFNKCKKFKNSYGFDILLTKNIY
jgi:FkbM family methyltransferase